MKQGEEHHRPVHEMTDEEVEKEFDQTIGKIFAQEKSRPQPSTPVVMDEIGLAT